MTSIAVQQELKYWLVLNRIRGFGGGACQKLLAINPKLSEWFNNGVPTPALLSFLKLESSSNVCDWAGVEKDLAFLDKPNHHILRLVDTEYPESLRQIASAPPVLFVLGDVSLLQTWQIALVGSRNPSIYGQEQAFAFAKGLSLAGLSITSGLALGIDAFCHRGALAGTGKTIAVLAHGLDRIYPSSHRNLAIEILEAKGALVSEFPIGVSPLPHHFPRRNRIISGLSLGVMVIEATVKSGSLITAYKAMEQGREVFAMPGSIQNPLAKGCHHLIREGAKCVETLEHVLEEIRGLIPMEKVPEFETRLEKKEIPTHLKGILATIGYECTPVDWVVERTGLSSRQVSPLLIELELSGVVSMVPGGYVRIS